MSPILKAEKISKQFKRKRENSNVFLPVLETDFYLENGELVIIAGPSGSGKSTLMNMLSGILEPTSGSVSIAGENIYEKSDRELSSFRNEHIGMIPQVQTAIQSLNVMANILLPFDLYKKTKEQRLKAIARAEMLMEQMQISDLKNVMPSEMSGGELRRMAIARALMNDPDIIFADEPTSDLDEENTEIVLRLFEKIAADHKAVLIVTHEKEVMNRASRLFKMKNGALEQIK